MADFNQALERTLRWEGGFQINPNDRGNYNSRKQLVGTNHGIAAFVYESWIGRPPSKDDMRKMTTDEAGNIYRSMFWNRIKGDEITDQALADILFDGHVNHGFTGIRIMQRTLGLKPDGKVGPKTLAALNNGNAPTIYRAYRQARRDFYQAIVKRRPSQAVFLRGWLNRINSFTDY